MKVRRLICEDFAKILRPPRDPVLQRMAAASLSSSTDCLNVDVLLTPSVISTAPLYSEFMKADNRTRCSENDIFTLSANMAGVPAISLPVRLSQSNLPIGLQLIAGNFQENILFKAARFLEQKAAFTGFIP